MKRTTIAAVAALLPIAAAAAKTRVMITGHRGYVGKALVEAMEDDYEIVGYDLMDGDDILDYDNLKRRMEGCEIVIHQAAIPAPVPGKTYDDYFRTNVEGTHNVARAAERNGVKRLIYASSTTVYGIESGIPFSYPITEEQPFVSQYLKADDLSTRDIDLAYHMSKVMAEQIAAWYGLNRKLQTIALRYGPIDKVMTGVHVSLDNAVQATLRAVAHPGAFWYEPFSIVDADVRFISIEKARRMLGYDPQPATYPDSVVIEPFGSRIALDSRYADRPAPQNGRVFTHADFYENGVFRKEVAKEAVRQSILRQGEAYTAKMDSLLWVSDFGLGDFEHVGLASITWLNDPTYGYFAMTMYLLPGQMIPEHAHRAITERPARPPKHESWRVVRGRVYDFSEVGEATPDAPAIPASFGTPVNRHFSVLHPGDTARLRRPESWHFMMAGPEGAIVDEYGLHHDRRGWHSSNPAAHPTK